MKGTKILTERITKEKSREQKKQKKIKAVVVPVSDVFRYARTESVRSSLAVRVISAYCSSSRDCVRAVDDLLQ